MWNERPWHIQGELLVLIPWRPRFDSYEAQITRADLWIRIPSFPTELFNEQSARAFLRLNELGEFIKLEHFTMIENKLKFASICVNVDITRSWISFVAILRNGVND